MTQDKTAKQLILDERNHVEKPFLDQFHGLNWEIIYDEKEFAAI